jgi:hypothetical protein
VSLVRIQSSWSPAVRYAARAYRRELRRAQRRFERSIQEGTTEGEALSTLCAEEAQAVITMLRRLGYGGGRLRGRARDRIELELQVHERDADVSLNFFRVYMAQDKDLELSEVLSRKGRERTKDRAEALRRQHMAELKATLRARAAMHAWLAMYYGRFELGKKYRELCRVQFDPELDDEARLSYVGLLVSQIANRTGRPRREVLEEYKALARRVLSGAEGGESAGDEEGGEGETRDEGGDADEAEGADGSEDADEAEDADE